MKKLLLIGMLALIGLTSYSQDTCEVVTLVVYEKIEVLQALSSKHDYFLDTTMGIIRVNPDVFNIVFNDTLYKVRICRKDELISIVYIVK